MTPEGVLADGVSPDGKFLIGSDADARLKLFPVDGGAARVVPGLAPGRVFSQWSEDGRSLYVRDEGLPTSVYKADLSTGKESVALRLMPTDPSGVAYINTVVMSRDGKTYAYKLGASLRMDFRCEVTADGLRLYVGEHKGSYPAWWQQIRVEVYGWTPRKRAARLNGQSTDSKIESSPNKVALTIPDNGRGEVLELE